MDDRKQQFLKSDLLRLLHKLPADAKGKWGVMNGQQMVEHFTDAVKNASGELSLPVVCTGEVLEKYRAFLWSEAPFKENTKNPLLGEQPSPLRNPDMESAVKTLADELQHFFDTFDHDIHKTTINPFFGELDYSGNVQLLHKHAVHHLTQFNLMN